MLGRGPVLTWCVIQFKAHNINVSMNARPRACADKFTDFNAWVEVATSQ